MEGKTTDDKVVAVPGLEDLMELIRFPQWEIKEHPSMGMFGLRIPNTKVFLAVPGGKELLEALRFAHEQEVDSYRKRLFALLSFYESSGEAVGLYMGIPKADRADFAAFMEVCLAQFGRTARAIVLHGEKIIDDALAKRVKGN